MASPMGLTTMNTNSCFGSCPPRPALWELRVLIVNPDLSCANRILHELEACGAIGVVVENLEQALAIYLAVHPNVVITKLGPDNPPNPTVFDETQRLLASKEEHPLAIAITDFPWMLDQTCKSAQTFHYHLFDPLDGYSLAVDIKKIIKERSLYSSTSRTAKGVKHPSRRAFNRVSRV